MAGFHFCLYLFNLFALFQCIVIMCFMTVCTWHVMIHEYNREFGFGWLKGALSDTKVHVWMMAFNPVEDIAKLQDSCILCALNSSNKPDPGIWPTDSEKKESNETTTPATAMLSLTPHHRTHPKLTWRYRHSSKKGEGGSPRHKRRHFKKCVLLNVAFPVRLQVI